MDSKTCTHCDIDKPLAEYYTHPDMPTGINQCKCCVRTKQKKWQDANKKTNYKNRRNRQQERNTLLAQNLSDQYIADLIIYNTSLNRSDIYKNPELIKAKRQQIKLYRGIINYT